MKKKNVRKIIVLVIMGLFVLFFCIWQNNDIVISHYSYKTSLIGDNLNGYKIAQISDLHNKRFGKNQKHLLNILDKENPDIIVITGDIVDSNHTNIDIALEFIKGAIELAPVYYVTGNHEYWLSNHDRDKLMKGMERNGVTILDNKVIYMEKENGNGYYLIGLSDKNLSDHVLPSICSSIDSNKLQILLAHEPQYFDNYSKADVDLVLSGHAHGGQIRLPFIGGLIAPDQGFLPKYTSGTYINKNTTMIVSRGLGNSIIPMRVFNRPEVVIISLQKHKIRQTNS
ncbi:metallophosphoesterase [Mobilitalea sibirica]|uniref:Metallophosphoesterase n=1 Tax=Mobilitalea sibirica TaxID=1462919 RepID=A0A8J7HEH1_9FIRM|nr:metallophosphoesterase [Mobilitalea sibirica]MBH1942259.1 metallophosphoesterase [Mobilitalea sibirica]